jgi:hypothetical protein
MSGQGRGYERARVHWYVMGRQCGNEWPGQGEEKLANLDG